MVHLRMDPRLRGRVDAGDVVQESFIEAMARYPGFQNGERFPVFLWLRFLTLQTLCKFHRRHLGVQARNVSREVSLLGIGTAEASSAVLADQLAGKLTTPSQAAVRGESRQRLEEAIQSMEPIDREVLALRHFEQLTNAEAASVLGIDESAASSRYVRALRRLKTFLEAIPLEL